MTVNARAGVMYDIADGAVVSGMPAINHFTWRRSVLAQLSLHATIRELSKRIKELEAAKDLETAPDTRLNWRSKAVLGEGRYVLAGRIRGRVQYRSAAESELASPP